MIRAMIGRFILHCLDQAGEAANRKLLVHEVEFDRMSDQQVSDWIHGRKIDFSRTGCRTIPHRGRVS